jgi:hypothetical protein
VPEDLPIGCTGGYSKTSAKEESKAGTDGDVRLLIENIVVDGDLVQ